MMQLLQPSSFPSTDMDVLCEVFSVLFALARSPNTAQAMSALAIKNVAKYLEKEISNKKLVGIALALLATLVGNAVSASFSVLVTLSLLPIVCICFLVHLQKIAEASLPFKVIGPLLAVLKAHSSDLTVCIHSLCSVFSLPLT
jgi:hypothetical protein